MNVIKFIRKLEIKTIYIYVKTDKDEYVKSIIYLYFFCKKKIGINNNYVVIRWRNRSSVVINTTLQLFVIYRFFELSI